MRSHFVNHNSTQIFLADYSHLTLDDFEQEIKPVTEAICAQPLNSVTLLTNVSGLLGSPQVIKVFIWSAKLTKPHICKLAIVGVGPSKARNQLLNIVLKSSGLDGRSFEDLEQAKDWLAVN